jgi:hypothetical protein
MIAYIAVGVMAVVFSGKLCFSQDIVLPDNVKRIELVFIVKDYKEVPENEAKKIVLEDKEKKHFLKDFNKLKLITKEDCAKGDCIFAFCYQVNIYTHKDEIFSFKTNGNVFYDIKNQALFFSDKNILKYWMVWEENACR